MKKNFKTLVGILVSLLVAAFGAWWGLTPTPEGIAEWPSKAICLGGTILALLTAATLATSMLSEETWNRLRIPRRRSQ